MSVDDSAISDSKLIPEFRRSFGKCQVFPCSGTYIILR